MSLVDLHAHSYFSPDGYGRPEDIILCFKRCGVETVSVTDHDTVAHIPAFLAAAKKLVSVIPGVELSCSFIEAGLSEIHLLCYFPDLDAKAWASSAMTGLLAQVVEARSDWLHDLAAEAEVEFWDLLRLQQRVVERGELHSSAVPSIQAVMRGAEEGDRPALERLRAVRQRWKMAGGSRSVAAFPSIERALRLLRAEGGVLCLAHPMRYALARDAWPDVLRHLHSIGMHAIEAAYLPAEGDMEDFLRFADACGLMVTIGGDLHDVPKGAMPAYAKRLWAARERVVRCKHGHIVRLRHG